MLRRVIEQRTEALIALVDDAKRTRAIDPALDTFSIVRFCHAVGLGFLLFGAVDLARPDAGPWEVLINRLIGAVAPDALPGSVPGSVRDAVPDTPPG
jgi:hypothetical protein